MRKTDKRNINATGDMPRDERMPNGTAQTRNFLVTLYAKNVGFRTYRRVLVHYIGEQEGMTE